MVVYRPERMSNWANTKTLRDAFVQFSFPISIHTSVTRWYSLILYYMIIVPPREWYKTILIQLQFKFVFVFILVVEEEWRTRKKRRRKLCLYYTPSTPNIFPWLDGCCRCCCCYVHSLFLFFLLLYLYWKIESEIPDYFRRKKQLVLICLHWWLLFRTEWRRTWLM